MPGKSASKRKAAQAVEEDLAENHDGNVDVADSQNAETAMTNRLKEVSNTIRNKAARKRTEAKKQVDAIKTKHRASLEDLEVRRKAEILRNLLREKRRLEDEMSSKLANISDQCLAKQTDMHAVLERRADGLKD
ncbi:MAG: hypothetical protein Q9159_004545 [Coniocarpon cinnabarinum]